MLQPPSYDATPFDVMQDDLVKPVKGMVLWYGMVWYGMVWYGMAWYGMVWYGMVLYCGVVWCGVVWHFLVRANEDYRQRCISHGHGVSMVGGIGHRIIGAGC